MFSKTAFSSALRQASRPLLRPSATPFTIPQLSRLSPLQLRLLSTETRAAIDKAVSTAPVVLFMKGTPEFPQCGFSRASIQILGMQGVDPKKFCSFNVLEDPELRQGAMPSEGNADWHLFDTGIKEYSDWPTIPQLYVNKEFIGGCDILMSMHQTGELAKILEEKGVLVEPEEEPGEEPGQSNK
ncbi:MAG: monothiol glutaredoxin grx5 [Cirrosporium novae-zelandiae]|nr:MAG: monothiol glutaredoxin grx5 [Cirrosporium novae-zelandiae]